ncbi:MAG: PQQ-binding-like beta-propeller repeat protein, partial [Gemmatimonadota bacterium]
MAAPAPADRHPLLPGIRCAEVWRPDWPRTLHDKQLTGFSPLTCGMDRAPEIWATVEAGGELSWARAVEDGDGRLQLLIDDGRLRAVTAAGQVRWTSPVSGELLFAGDLRGAGPNRGEAGLDLLLGCAHRLTLLDGATGQVRWERAFQPPHVRVRVAVGRALPGAAGLQAAVFLAYGEAGCLYDFSGGGDPELVWERQVVVEGEWPERYDHGVGIQLDLTAPDQPLIGNVRHHRCRALDARTGEIVSSLLYDLGGGRRRNYGPWSFGTGRDGRRYIVVVSEQVQTHVHGIRLERAGVSALAWQRYYGEVYEVPGV